MFENMVEQLDSFHLVVRNVNLTSEGWDGEIWSECSRVLSTHARLYSLTVHGYDLDATPRNYSGMPWALVKPGNRQPWYGQRLDAWAGHGVNFTLSELAAVAQKICNPFDRESSLAIFCKLYSSTFCLIYGLRTIHILRPKGSFRWAHCPQLLRCACMLCPPCHQWIR